MILALSVKGQSIGEPCLQLDLSVSRIVFWCSGARQKRLVSFGLSCEAEAGQRNEDVLAGWVVTTGSAVA